MLLIVIGVIQITYYYRINDNYEILGVKNQVLLRTVELVGHEVEGFQIFSGYR